MCVKINLNVTFQFVDEMDCITGTDLSITLFREAKFNFITVTKQI